MEKPPEDCSKEVLPSTENIFCLTGYFFVQEPSWHKE